MKTTTTFWYHFRNVGGSAGARGIVVLGAIWMTCLTLCMTLTAATDDQQQSTGKSQGSPQRLASVSIMGAAPAPCPRNTTCLAGQRLEGIIQLA
jgi:hypothetical protein